MNYPARNKDRVRKPVDISMYGKVPPQAKDLEEAILGAVMLEANAFMEIAQILRPEHFYVEAHQRIFEAICNLDKRSNPIDILTVVEELKRLEWLELIGGPYYVTKLTNNVISSANIKKHALIVLQFFIKRKFIQLGGEIVHMAYEDAEDFMDIDAHLQKLHDEIWSHINPVRQQNYMDIVLAAFDQIVKNDGSNPPGVLTGFPQLDKILLGLFGHLYVVAARPAMGKTAMVVQLAKNITDDGESSVGVIELETTSNAFAFRHIANESGISTDTLKKGGLSELQIETVYEAVQRIINKKILVDFASEQDLNLIRHKCREWKKKHKVKAVLIDYIQIIQGLSEHERLNREQQVSKLAYGLAAISKDLDLPIIAFAQLSREVLKRAGNRPTLGDLRESGAIEAAARVVMALHRPEYYEILEDEVGESTKGLTEVIVLKNNEGDTGTAKLFFQGHLSKYTDRELMDAWDMIATSDGRGIDFSKIPNGYKPPIDTSKFDDDTPF